MTITMAAVNAADGAWLLAAGLAAVAIMFLVAALILRRREG